MKKELKTYQVILRMIHFVKSLTIPMIFAIMLGVLGFVCAIAIPVLSIMALLQLTGMTPHIDMSVILVILLCLALFRGVLHYGEQASNHYIAFKLLAIIRDRVYTKLRKLAPAKLDGKDKGNLISLITNDIELLEVFYAHTISPIMIAVLTSLIMLKFFYHIHPIAALIALVAYLLMGIVIPFSVSHKGKALGIKTRDELGHMSSFLLESFRGILTILQYQVGQSKMDLLLEKSDHIEGVQSSMKKIESSQIIASQILISLSSFIMFVVMFILYQQGVINHYHTIMATVLMLSSFGPVLALSNLANNLLLTLSSGRRVIDLLDEEELMSDVDGKQETRLDDIVFSDVSFQYDEERVFHDFHLTLKSHQVTGIMGKSGSGKSTLLKLIMRFYDPQSGSINIHNKNMKDINTKDLRTMFAYVTQETVLFHDSILNNIKIAKRNATYEDIYDACKKANIHDFIMSLPEGYKTSVAELGSSLSSGERQRIGLARAFLSQAPCILLDEPTSQLDVLNEGMILKSLQASSQTLILVSHRKSILKIVDHKIIMNEGRVSS